jgi:hypothetical protein
VDDWFSATVVVFSCVVHDASAVEVEEMMRVELAQVVCRDARVLPWPCKATMVVFSRVRLVAKSWFNELTCRVQRPNTLS